MDYTFYIVAKISSPNSRSQRFYSMSSLRSCVVLGFTFGSVIHVKLIFLYSAKNEWKSFVVIWGFFSPMDIHLFQHYLSKRLSFLHQPNCVYIFVENKSITQVQSISRFYSVSQIYVSIFIYTSYWPYYNFVSLKSGSDQSSNFVVFFQNAL